MSACGICGDSEPFHAHDPNGRRMDNYYRPHDPAACVATYLAQRRLCVWGGAILVKWRESEPWRG